MKKILAGIFVLFTFQVSAQSADTLKDYNNAIPILLNTTALYDKLSEKIIISAVQENEYYKIELFDITGISIYTDNLYSSEKKLEIPVWLKQGIYILIMRNGQNIVTRKFRVN